MKKRIPTCTKTTKTLFSESSCSVTQNPMAKRFFDKAISVVCYCFALHSVYVLHSLDNDEALIHSFFQLPATGNISSHHARKTHPVFNDCCKTSEKILSEDVKIGSFYIHGV